MLNKQAKILSDEQIKRVLSSMAARRHGLRNKAMFLLSLHGLRAKEIASLELSMLTDAEGKLSDEIHLEDKATKGRSGRIVFMSAELQQAIADYLVQRNSNARHSKSSFLIVTQKSERFSANAVAGFFKRLYNQQGFKGASSHSGRRSYITRAARKIMLAGGSLRDVQALAGHKWISSTQRYVEQDVDAQRRVTSLLY
jgi:site-specific recombinase XerD